MKNRFRLRNYEPNDYQALLYLWEKTAMGSALRGDDAAIINNTIINGGQLFIMEDSSNKKLVASSWITNDQRRLYLHHFAVLPEYQGQGLSHQLLNASLKFAKEKNMQIKLEVHRKNEIAVNLYKNAGFDYLGDYDVYIIRNLNEIEL